MRISTLGEVAGIAAVVSGVWMVYAPAGVIAAGVGLVLWAQGREGGDE